MIMQRQPDGTYAQIGFIKSQNEDIEQIVDANGDVYFTPGFAMTASGCPLILNNTISKPLSKYKIFGNIQQNGTPTPEAPVEVLGVGNKTGNGYEIPVVCRGKNLFDKNGEKIPGFINGVGEIIVETPNRWYVFNKKIKCSGVITVHALNGLGVGTFIKCYDNSDHLLGAVEQGRTNENKRTISLFPNTAYIQTCCRDNNFDSYQIELGSTTTEYEPYHEPITTALTLDKPLYKDDYITKDKSGGKVHRAWGVKVFDGTEEWTRGNFGGSGWLQFYTQKPPGMQNDIADTKNTHFINKKGGANGSDIGEWYNLYPSASLLPENATADDFKSWLASEYAQGTPVTVYYPLAEPTEESIELTDIPTFDGTTIIETGTELPASNIEASYKAKTDT